VLESLSPWLSVHRKNVKIGGHMRLVGQFEGKVVLDPELETNMENK
jgi:hypothetical protein